MDTSPFEPDIIKEGTLAKLGGGAGGHKNWKDRYFVLTDHLYYYGSKADYTKDPKSPLGRINLLSYFVARSEPGSLEFYVHAYPKVSGLCGEILSVCVLVHFFFHARSSRNSEIFYFFLELTKLIPE